MPRIQTANAFTRLTIAYATWKLPRRAAAPLPESPGPAQTPIRPSVPGDQGTVKAKTPRLAALTRRASISPPREPSRDPRSFGRYSPVLTHAPAYAKPLHGQSILEVLRTRPLTAPAPGSDRRLSGEAHQVGGNSHRSDHEPRGTLPGLPRRWPGARTRMHVRRQREPRRLTVNRTLVQHSAVLPRLRLSSSRPACQGRPSGPSLRANP
jgi:hypothetical protein